MLWLITRVNANKPGNAEAREAGLTKHREYLRSQKQILLLSGGLRSDDGEESIGSFFIVNVENRAAAQAFVDGIATVTAYMNSSRLRALAVTSTDPSSLAPGMPTVAATACRVMNGWVRLLYSHRPKHRRRSSIG